MDVNVGLVEAIKMIEDRIWGGKYITTTAMLLGALSVIIVSLRYIVSSVIALPVLVPSGVITSPIILRTLAILFWAIVGFAMSEMTLWVNRLYNRPYEQMRDALRELQSKVAHFEQVLAKNDDDHRK
jgi:hypothetical protein